MKKLLAMAALMVAVFAGCAKNDNSSDSGSSSTSNGSFGCLSCSTGGAGTITGASTVVASDYSNLTHFNMQMTQYGNGQVTVNGSMTILSPNQDTCYIPAGQYPFTMTAMIVGNNLLQSNAFYFQNTSILIMYLQPSNPTIVLQANASGGFDAVMHIMTPQCDNNPFVTI